MELVGAVMDGKQKSKGHPDFSKHWILRVSPGFHIKGVYPHNSIMEKYGTMMGNYKRRSDSQAAQLTQLIFRGFKVSGTSRYVTNDVMLPVSRVYMILYVDL